MTGHDEADADEPAGLPEPSTDGQFPGGAFRFADRLERRIVSKTGKAVADFQMIQAGARLLVAVSGGKDSLSLLRVLGLLRRRSPVPFELHAATIDQGDPSFDPRPLLAISRAEGVPHHIEAVPMQDILRAKLSGGAIPCSLCSRIRRGALYTLAIRLGCDTLALGHHLDDLLETLLLNLFYSGQLRSMAPRRLSDDGRCLVIRPLCYVPEAWLREYATRRGFPVHTCSGAACGVEDKSRVQVKRLIETLDTRIHGLRGNMLRALCTVRSEHLLDPRLRLLDSLSSRKHE